MTVRRALISVSDKRGVAEFAAGLAQMGVEILSTGGTHRALAEAGVPVTRVSELTGQEEILGGRVKTLHPAIHGGILADRSQPSHVVELRKHGISPIDLVAVNLYPFREVSSREESSWQEVIEAIDIGGPTMVRAAAKNHKGVVVVIDPDDYDEVLAALREHGGAAPEALRRELALKAFRHTQAYDAAISAWLERQATGDSGELPRYLTVNLERDFEPRYGENPHQVAAVYRDRDGGGLFHGFTQLQGKKLSFNNMLDAEAARRMVSAFDSPAVVIMKHNNPCGVGRGRNLTEAYERALACDPTSAFGSVIALNGVADRELAEAMRGLFVEVVIAPGCDEAAAEVYSAKKNLRLLTCPFDSTIALDLKPIDGGFIAQTADSAADEPESWSCPTRRSPTVEEERALRFAWAVVRGVKSNAIVVANERQTVGIGAGQMSRVDACRIAIQKAEIETSGCVAASDAFFPFRDGPDLLAKAGITAIIQPGGSKRDEEVVAAADEAGIAMLMTGRRHFRH